MPDLSWTHADGVQPRAANLVLYVLAPGAEALRERLGPHRRGVSCLYITNLDKVDNALLRELVRNAWEHDPA